MDELKKAYGKLFDSVNGTKWEKGFYETQKDAVYTTFTAMQGNQYFMSKNSVGEEFRFMLVGRAVNGWDEYRISPEEKMTKDDFIESSILNLENAEKSIVFGKDRFEWIDTSENRPRNTAREGIDRGEIKGDYKLSKAQIWSYTKDIWDSLYGEKTIWSDRWFEKIVWSNLYKLAPREGGNPEDALQQLQLNACIDLLKAEIEYFRPTHIFFATGRDYWFDKFQCLFRDKKRKGTNISRGEHKNKEYVEMTAKYIYEDGTVANVVVACRPESRAKVNYVEEVVATF